MGFRTKLFLSLALALATSGCLATRVSFQSPGLGPHDQSSHKVVGTLAKPGGKGRFPAVVLLHTCGGVENHLNVWSDFLTSRGYIALVVDSFGSRGLGRCPNGVSTAVLAQSEMVSDAYGALDYLAAQPDVDADRIYVMGFSLGGWALRSLANRESRSQDKRNFKAGIALYDACGYFGRLPFPVMVVIGTLDGHDFHSCKNAVETKPSPDLEVHILEGVYHAFDQDRGPVIRYDVGRRPMLYDRRAVRTSEELVEAFLAKHR